MVRSNLKQRGDTIVEVLIAIGIISLVLTVAYVTANHNYLSMQDAQERGNALKLLERQTEALKAYNAEHHGTLAGLPSFCMTIDTTGNIATATPPDMSQKNPCVVDSDGTPAEVGQEPAYTLTITKPNPEVSIGTGRVFLVTAQWDSILGDGKDKAQLEYGLY